MRFEPFTGTFWALCRGTPEDAMRRHIEVEKHIALSRHRARWN